MRIGIVGLGLMGLPISRRLLSTGFGVVALNRSRPPLDEVVKLGALAATSPKGLAEVSEAVLTSLPDTAAVEEVYLAADGLLAGARQGQILADLSTVGPATSRKIADAALSNGVGFLDAPVSGGPAGAAAGTLTFMIGGQATSLAQIRPVLEVLGQQIHHVGPSGAGSIVKLANQLLVAINMSGVVEAMVLGVKAGVDPRMMLDVLSTSLW